MPARRDAASGGDAEDSAAPSTDESVDRSIDSAVDQSTESTDAATVVDGDETSIDPLDPAIADVDHVIVVGYDAWTEPVLVELAERGVPFSVVTTDGENATRLEDRGLDVVQTDDVDEACFRAAGIADADAVLVATLDDQLNVLAVLTVMNVNQSMHVVTFAGERQDVPKLRAAGADRVVSIGQAVGELLVEVALAERDVADVVRELIGSGS